MFPTTPTPTHTHTPPPNTANTPSTDTPATTTTNTTTNTTTTTTTASGVSSPHSLSRSTSATQLTTMNTILPSSSTSSTTTTKTTSKLTKLFIRSPNLPDLQNFSVEIDPEQSTILELKQRLFETFPMKPIVSDQKIIFAGKLIENHLLIKDVLEKHPVGETPTFHMVTTSKPQPSSSSVIPETELRHRRPPTTTATTTTTTTVDASPSPTPSSTTPLHSRTTSTQRPTAIQTSASSYSIASSTAPAPALPELPQGWSIVYVNGLPFATPSQYATQIQQWAVLSPAASSASLASGYRSPIWSGMQTPSYPPIVNPFAQAQQPSSASIPPQPAEPAQPVQPEQQQPQPLPEVIPDAFNDNENVNNRAERQAIGNGPLLNAFYLLLKLSLLIILFGQHASMERLVGLYIFATGVFVWQMGWLAWMERVWNRRNVNPPQNPPQREGEQEQEQPREQVQQRRGVVREFVNVVALFVRSLVPDHAN